MFMTCQGSWAWCKDPVNGADGDLPVSWLPTTRPQWICLCPRTGELHHRWGCTC